MGVVVEEGFLKFLLGDRVAVMLKDMARENLRDS